MKRAALLSVIMTLFFITPALAHFQMLYTPESALEKGGEMTLKLVFSHPFGAGHTMDMSPVEEFYVLQQRGEKSDAKKVDLKEYLKEISWESLTNKGKAYEAVLPAQVVRSMGDNVFVLVPNPYYEAADEEYIQQYTKMILNVGGVPGNWLNQSVFPPKSFPWINLTPFGPEEFFAVLLCLMANPCQMRNWKSST
jgi:cobalt/nickel transport protein